MDIKEVEQRVQDCLKAAMDQFIGQAVNPNLLHQITCYMVQSLYHEGAEYPYIELKVRPPLNDPCEVEILPMSLYTGLRMAGIFDPISMVRHLSRTSADCEEYRSTEYENDTIRCRFTEWKDGKTMPHFIISEKFLN